jgi:arginyl-tRNA synthetase
VLALWGGDPADLKDGGDPGLLQSPYELALLQRLGDFPETLENAAREFAPHLIAYYLRELAAELHSYYNAEQFLVEDEALKLARLSLVTAIRQVLRNGLAVLGVGCPEKM